MREFYITDKGGNYIEDIDEATNYSLEKIKNCYQFRKVKSFKYKITAECDYKMLKLLKYFSIRIILIIMQSSKRFHRYKNMVTSIGG